MHKIVSVGDSMTMGFKSGAIYEPHLSYPSLISLALGTQDEFTYPKFDGGENIGGLPLNLETIIEILSEKFPKGLKLYNYLPSVFTVNRHIARVEKYWERGEGNSELKHNSPYHNLSVLTFGISDSFRVSECESSKFLPKPRNNRILFTQIPEMPIYRAARRTLNPSFGKPMSAFTQMCSAEKLANEKGIENLIVFLGANNCLGAIIDLELLYSQEADIYRLPHERRSNLWLPEHFRKAFSILARKIEKIDAGYVYIATIPKVTIPPVSRGWGDLHNGYFDYYTRAWLWDDVFDPCKDPFITRGQAQQIDTFIDEYNDYIKATCYKKGWNLIDICSLLDSIAFRRNQGVESYSWPKGAKEALANNQSTSYLVKNGKVNLDTRYLRLWETPQSHSGPIKSGGLFSLDGVHPTTICYGLIAEQFLDAMVDNGVRNIRNETPFLDWDHIVQSDNLITNPPIMLKDLRKLLSFLSGKASGRVMLRLLEKFKGNV
ncbi:hypothetical protein CHISP_3032 [Chitinispirillum alkaliphilum]|nr:hypothetical protein CHISP_3032 [Chitinispirillum alkaliphilum]